MKVPPCDGAGVGENAGKLIRGIKDGPGNRVGPMLGKCPPPGIVAIGPIVKAFALPNTLLLKNCDTGVTALIPTIKIMVIIKTQAAAFNISSLIVNYPPLLVKRLPLGKLWVAQGSIVI